MPEAVYAEGPDAEFLLHGMQGRSNGGRIPCEDISLLPDQFRQFFRDFDADCDWSKALQGEIGEYISVVRRSGDRFFYGATTDASGRTLTEKLDFLQPGIRYHATIYADAPDTDWQTNPYAYVITEREVTDDDTLEVVLAPGGGQAITFIPVSH